MKKRKIPMRKCVVTHEMKPKKELLRIVKNKEGIVSIDLTGKKPGRGAYVTKNKDVIETAKKQKVLNEHLNSEIDEHLYDEILALIEQGN